MKTVYYVITLGYWGRSTMLSKAALECCKSGGSRRDKALVYKYTGPPEEVDKITVDSQGNIEYPQTVESKKIYGLREGDVKITLGKLTKSDNV